MSSRNRNRNIVSKPIICAGIAATIGVACLTGLATNAAISKFNADADRAYAAAVEEVRAKQLADWLAQHSSSSGSSLNYIPEIDKIPIAPTDIIEIDGKFYINADLVVNPDGTHAEDCPCYYCRYGEEINEDDKIIIDGKDYIFITDPSIDFSDSDDPDDGSGGNGGTTNPFEGIDYISIDVNGNAIYLIERGDTLSQISGRVGYSVDALAEYNDIRNVNLIYEGSSLRIPVTEDFYNYIQSSQGSDNTIDSEKLTAVEQTVPAITEPVVTVPPVVEEPVIETRVPVQEPVVTTPVTPREEPVVTEKPVVKPAPQVVTQPKPEVKPAETKPAPKPEEKPATTTKPVEKPKEEPEETKKPSSYWDDIEIVEEPFVTGDDDDILYDYEYEEIFLDDLFDE